MKEFVIHGNVISKKNSRVINFKLKRSFPSAAYTKWHEAAVAELLLQKQGFTTEKCKIVMKFFYGDLVRRDIDNGTSSVFDTLVDAGILLDDNWKVVNKLMVESEYDKGNARCVIQIYEPSEVIEYYF